MTAKGKTSKRRLAFDNNYSVVALIILLCVILTIKTTNFLSYDNIYSVFYGISIQFFAALGFILLIILGEINLAVGAMYGLSGTLVGYCIAVFKWKLWPSIGVVLILCALFGWGLGWLITKFRLNSMMVTLGLQTFLFGLNSLVFNGFPTITYASDYRAIARHRIMGIHWTILAMVLIIVLMQLFLYKLPALRQLYYVGSSRETADLYGINSARIKRLTFMVSMLSAAVGGIISTSRVSYSDLNTGKDMIFTLIIATVIGGASLGGGKGNVLQIALGLVFVSLLSNVMAAFQFDPYQQQVVMGIILIIAVLLDARVNRTAQ